MSPNPALSIRASEEFINSIIAAVQAVEPSCAKGLTQIFLHGITADVEPHTADLADTLPWMCPNDTGISGEAPKPLTPPPEVPLYNKYDPLTPTRMCDQIKNQIKFYFYGTFHT